MGDNLNIDSSAILALISSLTQQVAALERENASLRATLKPDVDSTPTT